MSGRLINEETGETIGLEEVSSIGRSRHSVVVIADPRVSRRHALVRVQEDGCWFFDLGSVNGSYINSRRVTTAQVLRNGDILQVGNHRFRFEQSETQGGEASQSTMDVTMADVSNREAIIFVSDIQGFTTLSERLEPDQLAPIIGSWYAATERILDAYGGTLDKFIGDCALAYWLGTSPESRLAALEVAQVMMRSCDEVQREHQETLASTGLEFRLGAAVHLGPTAYGAFSSQAFTLLGDAVNLAFRLESLTRNLGERVVISGDVLDGWDEGRARCRSLGFHQVKGREQAVEVFGLK